MANEVVNILTLFGSSKDVQEVVRSFNIDEGDITTLIAPNKIRIYSNDFCPYSELEEISVKFPKIKIKVQFADEDLGYNVGEFYLLNGIVSDLVEPVDGSDEAYEMAIMITGDDFYITDFLYGIEEEELNEEFPMLCVKLAFKFRKSNPMFPTFVLNMFEKWAVNIEDYEFASEVRNNIEVQNIKQ